MQTIIDYLEESLNQFTYISPTDLDDIILSIDERDIYANESLIKEAIARSCEV
jgi:hypothetical protein